MGKRATAEELLRELMRRNASLGGKARISKLTPAQRSELGRRAGKASGRARKARSR